MHCPSQAKAQRSVDNVADLRKRGPWFDPLLDQRSFLGLMTVIAKGFIPLSPLSVVSTMVMWEKQPVAWKEYRAEYWLKELQESMDKCTSPCVIQSINQSIVHLSKSELEWNWSIYRKSLTEKEDFLPFPQCFLPFQGQIHVGLLF